MVAMVGYFFAWKRHVVAILLLAVGAAAAAPPNCHEIEENTPYSDFKDCAYTDGFGNNGKFIQLDFTNASGAEINQFFAKATAPTTLSAAIRIVGNNDLEILNFGQITTWNVLSTNSDDHLVEIVNNPNLAKIEWGVTSINKKNQLKVIVYNNPLLKLEDDKVKLLKDTAVSLSYINAESGVCFFEDPFNKTNYIQPEQNLLDNCQRIKGDLNLENLKLAGDLTLMDNNACLRLVNVEMLKGKVKFEYPYSGSDKCKNGNSSEIKENIGLCRDDFAALGNFFPKKHKVSMVDDSVSCNKICEKLNETGCIIFDNDLIIRDGTPLDLLKELEIIKGRLIIHGTLFEHLKFPSLLRIEALPIRPPPGAEMSAEKIRAFHESEFALQVTGNSRLSLLEFPLLMNVTAPGDVLVRIEGNPHLKKVDGLPTALLQACLSPEDHRCIYPAFDSNNDADETTTWSISWYPYLLVFCATAGFALRAALRPYSVIFETQMRMELLNEQIRHLERKHREEWRRLASRQNKLKYDDIYFNDYMNRTYPRWE